MNIIGNKVILRAIEEWDNEILKQLVNDPETEKMIGGYSYPISKEHQLNWFHSLNDSTGGPTLRCMIADQKSKETGLGTILLSQLDWKNGTAEIHIKLVKNAHGKGYGTDAVHTMVSYAFQELRMNCIYCNILEDNKASRKLFEKCGFEQEGVLRSRVFKGACYRNVCCYSILRGI